MSLKFFRLLTFFLFTLSLSSTSFADAYRSNLGGITYFEGVAETDGTAELSGFHFISYVNNSNSPLAMYYGGGPVYVTLPEQNDSFLAIHVLTGADIMLTNNIGFNFEFGFDLGEQLISDEDESLPSANGTGQNNIDFNMSAGVVVNLDNTIYVKGYVRYHAFDGVLLPPTDIFMAGVRGGIRF